MNATQEISRQVNRFNQQEIEAASAILFDSFYLDEKKVNGSKNVEEQIFFLENFIHYLNRLLKSSHVTTAEQRVTLLKTIAKLTLQKEVMEVRSGKVKFENLQIAAERMGKKSQSAVMEF